MVTTFATHNPQRRSRSQHATFAALLALAIAVGLYGVVNYASTAVDPVGVGSASALPNEIDQAFVNALARNYPPVEQAADYTAANRLIGSGFDPAFVNALARNYPPVEQAADYTAAAG